MRATLRSVGAVLAGIVAGLLLVLGILAFQTSVAGIYLHEWTELVGVRGIPVVLAPTLLAWIAIRLGPRRFWQGLGGLAVAVVTGAAAGGAAGVLLHSHPTAPWAGGMMGAGVGVVLGVGRLLVGASAGIRGALLLLVFFGGGCTPSADPAPDEIHDDPMPDSSEVESVVFLLGDPGEARMGTHPILSRLRQDVERWSRAVGGKGEVSVVVLGDILYPGGLHEEGDAERTTDSLRLVDQIGVVAGGAADSAGARMWFVPGNHDWGQEVGAAGAVRLEGLDDFLGRWRGEAAGRLALRPEPGGPGPSVVDLGRHGRLVLLDTAWWLLGGDAAARAAMLEGVAHALATAGERRVIVAAHHPLESGGPHGAGVDLGSFLGIRLLLKKAGILLQDMDSRPYSALRIGLARLFERHGPPDLFVAGHEHSLQLFTASSNPPTRHMVIGSGSKLTAVGDAPDMLFGRSEPGYGVILILRNGDLHIQVEAAPSRFLRCDGSSRPDCLTRGVAAYRTVWSERLPREATAGP